MHVILASVGTDGDINPFLGLGIQLRSRGHRVTLVANEHVRDLAAQRGLEFTALISNREYDEFLAHPDMWHPIKTVRRTARWGAQLVERQYALLADLASAKDTVLATSVAIVGARLVQEKLGRPLASVLLQPWMIPSSIAPPVMPGGLTLPRWAPRPLGKFYWRMVNAVGDLFIGDTLNRLRTKLGLRPVRRVFEWWQSPELVIGMFPDWYGPPQADWTPQIKLAGFPLCDGGSTAELAPDLLGFCKAGPPPVAFTFGTGMMHGAQLFQAAAEACGKLGTRGILLTKFTDQLPTSLPPSIRHCAFAPFRELFPHCAAVVHHGGIGTTAKALTTGTPQLVLPLAFDQMDNAVRVERLGRGEWLSARNRHPAAIALAITRLTAPAMQTHCRSAGASTGDPDGVDRAAVWIEELAESRGRHQ